MNPPAPVILPTFTVAREGGGEAMILAVSPDGTQAVVWEAYTAVSTWSVLLTLLVWACFALLLLLTLYGAWRVLRVYWRGCGRVVGVRYCAGCGYRCDAQAWLRSPTCPECGGADAPVHRRDAWLVRGPMRLPMAMVVLCALSVLTSWWADGAESSQRWPSVTLAKVVESMGWRSWRDVLAFRVAELVVYDVQTGRRVRLLDTSGRYRVFSAVWSRQWNHASPVDALAWRDDRVVSIQRRFDVARMRSDWVVETWDDDLNGPAEMRVLPIVDPSQLPEISELTSAASALSGAAIRLEQCRTSAGTLYVARRDGADAIEVERWYRVTHHWYMLRREQFAYQFTSDGERMVYASGPDLAIYDVP